MAELCRGGGGVGEEVSNIRFASSAGYVRAERVLSPRSCYACTRDERCSCTVMSTIAHFCFHFVPPSLRSLRIYNTAIRSHLAPAQMSLCLRHEFLGPDPRVAGYKLDANGEYHIKWYDAFLKDHWVDDQKWDFDVRLDARGNWVEVDDDAE